MLESSVFLENSGGGASGGSASDAAAVEFGNEGGGGEEGSRNSGGKRWPREETLSLLKIRSEMDTAFRDSNLKAPLWDEVSRKLGELGYNRNAKKCKEKFENIYKYHKRTKDGRSIRHKGKNYKFFDQLELLDSQFSVPSTPLNQIPSYATETTQIATTLLPKPITNLFQDFTIPSELMSDSTSTSSSSGKDSQGSSKKKKKKKKKRKLEDYLEGLVKDILEKQEEMQNKFLEAVEKSQNDRMARTEAWLSQEMATIKRERQILAQERSTASAKDAYVLDFLKKITHQDLPITHISEILDPLFNNKPCDNNEQENAVVNVNSMVEKNGSSVQTSSSRWPKAEVESLILLKTDLDMQYEENGPKGPLWEEISACMKKLGFERSAKRCKEKWENINKYYKRVKDGNKKRPQDSKTCPYFSMLESIYANKSKKSRNNDNNNNNNTDVSGGGCNLKPEQILMQMMGQVQQQNQEQLIRGEYDDGDSDRQEQEDDDVSGCDGYQVVVANNNNNNMS